MESSGSHSSKKKILVTFDVDGTLIQSTGPASNRLHRRAFSHAFLDVFGIKDATIDVIQHHGQTDPGVIVNTLVHYGIPSEVATEKLPDLKARMVEYAKEHAQDIGEGLQVLPGVASLLHVLSSKEDVAIGLMVFMIPYLFVNKDFLLIYKLAALICLAEWIILMNFPVQVTGNLEEIAWLKMEGLCIRKYFTVPNFGGFGSDHIDRGHLVKIAADRAEKLFPGGFNLRVHVGDTPNDIRAAEFGGALAVGVCTGIFTKEELEQASNGNAVILEDLVDTNAFMNLMGI